MSATIFIISYLARIQVGKFKPETRDGQLNVGPRLLHAWIVAQHSRHFFVGTSFAINSLKAGRLTHPVDALPETITKYSYTCL